MWFHREMNSTFYVDSRYESSGLTNNKMENEVRTLKEELARTQENLKAATKRCRDLVRELDNRSAVHESEKVLRDQQLSRILRALLVLEARLKQEQKSIRQLLCEKDNIIRNQQLEITRLRRYTKNYIKSKREQSLGRTPVKINDASNNIDKSPLDNNKKLEKTADPIQDNGLSKDIHNLKCEIITKLNPSETPISLEELDRGIKKTHSFAGSDISKTSLTSSENTDVSIITTTTEGSPSLLSTEGFCEGESTDVSPSSTLNKSNRCTPTTVTDSENETTMIFEEEEEDAGDGTEYCNENKEQAEEGGEERSKRKTTIGRSKTQKFYKDHETMVRRNIVRSESKDDGMDCNFVSEDEDKEPIYVNSCSKNNVKNRQQHVNLTEISSKFHDTYVNGNNDPSTKIDVEKQNNEETSGNWYSDPDEDRINDDVFRHTSYRPNSNHNSVLECVNQILLRDMEEEDHVLSVPRRFKHKGRIVRFQPARLSDIESVGSEMERRNSEEGLMDKETTASEDFAEAITTSNFATTATEDEYGMKIDQTISSKMSGNIVDAESINPLLTDNSEPLNAVPIMIIEPKIDSEEETSNTAFVLPNSAQKAKTPIQSISPPLRMERIEEKVCLQMSTKRLTIAKNLDYEDIESLPEVMTPVLKTPPALPPKPQFKNNTLILKKIPSPSFLIDETRKKSESIGVSEHNKKIFNLISSPIKSSTVRAGVMKSLNLEDVVEEGNFWKSKFNNVRSSFQVRHSNESEQAKSRKIPRVTNIVRHFEEFKIGGDAEEQPKEREKAKERYTLTDFDQEFDIRQNFEEFKLDECDLSYDPSRAEADGSERLINSVLTVNQNESSILTRDNNSVSTFVSSSNTGYDNFLEATGLSNKSILTPSRLLSNHKSMLKPKDVKYKNKIKGTVIMEKHGTSANTTHVKHWTGPFV